MSTTTTYEPKFCRIVGPTQLFLVVLLPTTIGVGAGVVTGAQVPGAAVVVVPQIGANVVYTSLVVDNSVGASVVLGDAVLVDSEVELGVEELIGSMVVELEAEVLVGSTLVELGATVVSAEELLGSVVELGATVPLGFTVVVG